MNENKRERKFLKGFKSIQSTIFVAVSVLVLCAVLAAEGKSIIMISSEMTEILRMSDRIIVMCEGKVTGNIDISEATQEHIMNKATRNID